MTDPSKFHATDEDRAKALASRAEKRAEWAKLNLRQKWMDEGFMREHLAVAGVRVGSDMEPASVSRLRSLLRKVDIHGAQIKEAIGGDLVRYLTLNPNLPLWAALALLLEADGRFTDEVLKQRAGIDERSAIAA